MYITLYFRIFTEWAHLILEVTRFYTEPKEKTGGGIAGDVSASHTCALESAGRLVTAQMTVPLPAVSDWRGLAWGPRVHMSSEFLGAGDAAGWGPLRQWPPWGHSENRSYLVILPRLPSCYHSLNSHSTKEILRCFLHEIFNKQIGEGIMVMILQCSVEGHEAVDGKP